VDTIRWYEIRVYQRVWTAEVTNMDGRFGPYPKVWVGQSMEFGNMVSITDDMSDDPFAWEWLVGESSRQMDEAIRNWAGSNTVLVGPREWTCKPFMQSEWDYMVRKGLVEEQPT